MFPNTQTIIQERSKRVKSSPGKPSPAKASPRPKSVPDDDLFARALYRLEANAIASSPRDGLAELEELAQRLPSSPQRPEVPPVPEAAELQAEQAMRV